jgi:dipeptidase
LRDWLPNEVGGVCWFSFDNPGQSPRVPIFCGTTQLPVSYENCGQKRFREDAAIWAYRKANKLATVSWGKTKETVLGNVLAFESKATDELPSLELKIQTLNKENNNKEVSKHLNQYTANFSGATMQRWLEMEQQFWGMFGRGF